MEMEDIIPIAAMIGAVVGLVGAEVMYFTKADEVRLLFVILLIPGGAIAGAAAAAGLTWLTFVVFGLSLIAGAIALVVFIIGGAIKLLYNAVVWTN